MTGQDLTAVQFDGQKTIKLVRKDLSGWAGGGLTAHTN